MRENERAQRHDRDELVDPPQRRRELGQIDHRGDHDEAERERDPELLDQLPDFDEEGRVLDFLHRGAPLHVDPEQVREDGAADVDGDAAEEDVQQEHPLEVLEDGGQEADLADTVAVDGDGEQAEAAEDDDDGEEDAEGVDVEVVEVGQVPADEEEVGRDEEVGGADGVVRADVGEDRHFRRERHAGGEESAEDGGEGAARGPVVEGVEDEFAAAEGVFLPAGQFVVDGERDTLFEFRAFVPGEPDHVADGLEAESEVEILGHGILGPVLFDDFGFRRGRACFTEGDFLERGPADEGVVADKRTDVSGRNDKGDGGVDQGREERDAVFEKAVGDVEHA